MKKILSVLLLSIFACVLALPTEVNAKVVSDMDILSSNLTMAASDIDGNAVVVEPKAHVNDKVYNTGGRGGSLYVDGTMALAGTEDGIAIRLKNLSEMAEKFRVYLYTTTDSSSDGFCWVYNGSKYSLISVDGTATEYTVTGRACTIPASFDGTLVIEYSELCRYRYNGTDAWSDATTANKLVKGATDKTSYPAGTLQQLKLYFEIANGINEYVNPIAFESISTYTKVYTDEVYSSTTFGTKYNFNTEIGDGSSDNFVLSKYDTTLSFDLDLNGDLFTANKTSFKYGDVIELTAKGDAEYSTVALGEDYFKLVNGKWCLTVTKDYSGKALTADKKEVGTALSITKFTENDILINPTAELGSETSYALYAGSVYAANQVALESTSGFAIRIRNTSSSIYYVSRWFIRTTTGYEYMPGNAAADFELIDASGSTIISQYKARGFNFPANFDGWLVVDWSDLYIFYPGTSTLTWSGAQVTAPSGNLLNLKLDFMRRGNNADTEILVGDFATFVTAEDGTRTFTNYGSIFETRDSNLATANLEVSNIPFNPQTIACDDAKVTLNQTSYGYSEKLVVTLAEGYSICSASLDGNNLTKNSDGTYSMYVTKATTSKVVIAGHTEEEIPAVAATCTEAGKTAGKKCSVCGEILVAQEDTEALGHSYGDPYVQYTHVADGYVEQVKKCSVCGDVQVLAKVYLEQYNALIHNATPGAGDSSSYSADLANSKLIVNKMSTSVNQWARVGFKANSNSFKYAYLVVKGSADMCLGAKVDGDNNPYDSKSGNKQYKGTSEEIAIFMWDLEALGIDSTKVNKFVLWAYAKSGSSVTSGEVEIIAMGLANATAGTEPVSAHIYSELKAYDGGHAMTCVCGAHEAIEAHTEEEIKAVAATCTEAGKTAGKKCSVCGEILVAQEEVPALGHTEEVIPAVAATCTEAGKTAGKKCSVCGEILVAQEDVPALGHTEEVIPAVAATCIEAGKTEGKKCSVCGEILAAQEEVPALGHTEEEIPAVAATCTEAGKTAGKKCSVCGEILVAQEEVPALGHTEEAIPAVAATCTEAGKTEGKKCSVCGEILVAQEDVPALGHSYGEWVQTKAPTAESEGEETRTCSVCGMTEIRPVEKLPSTEAPVTDEPTTEEDVTTTAEDVTTTEEKATTAENATSAKKSGCGSMISSLVFIPMIALGACLAFKRKENE